MDLSVGWLPREPSPPPHAEQPPQPRRGRARNLGHAKVLGPWSLTSGPWSANLNARPRARLEGEPWWTAQTTSQLEPPPTWPRWATSRHDQLTFGYPGPSWPRSPPSTSC